MKVTAMALKDALAQGEKIPYLLARSLSKVTLGPVAGNLETADLTEARFFSEIEEIRIFRQNGELHAVSLREEDGELYVDHTYEISNKDFGAQITVRSCLGFDEDGQACWSGERLISWKGENVNG